MRFIVPITILGLAGIAWLWLDFAKPEPEKHHKLARPVSVYVEPAEQADLTLKVTVEGEVRARTEINLVSQVAGRVVTVSPEFTEGGRVFPGVPLLHIEDTDYRLALAQAKAQVANAEVNVEESLATANVARKQLRNAQNASPLALKQPQMAAAQARLKAAKAALSLAELNLARTQFSLPFAGRVKEKTVGVGQFVSPGTPLGRAFATDVVQIRISLTDRQLASLGLPIGFVAGSAQDIAVNLSALVGGQQHVWQGKLMRLDASIDSATRALFGLVEVNAPYTDNVSQHQMPLAVGLYVKAEITGRQIAGATLIPRNGLRVGNQVYVVNEQGKLEIREVDVIHSSEINAVIGNGLEPSEQIVVSSIRNPIPGMRLNVLRSTETAISIQGQP